MGIYLGQWLNIFHMLLYREIQYLLCLYMVLIGLNGEILPVGRLGNNDMSWSDDSIPKDLMNIYKK